MKKVMLLIELINQLSKKTILLNNNNFIIINKNKEK